MVEKSVKLGSIPTPSRSLLVIDACATSGFERRDLHGGWLRHGRSRGALHKYIAITPSNAISADRLLKFYTSALISSEVVHALLAFRRVSQRNSEAKPWTANHYGESLGANNTGLGSELSFHNGQGMETEVGYAGPDWSFSGNGAVGVGSVDASYHFPGAKSPKKITPFASGGYSLYFRQRTTFESGTTSGLGTNFWVLKQLALRSEIRYQGGINTFEDFSQFTHYVAFRFGIAFR
jgi:hypothetical protein